MSKNFCPSLYILLCFILSPNGMLALCRLFVESVTLIKISDVKGMKSAPNIRH